VTTKRKAKKEHLFCPYCDQEIVEADLPYCQACQVTVFYCPVCRKPVPRQRTTCPHCGAAMKC
jgi:predicted amidophosphoribosyltransferase